MKPFLWLILIAAALYYIITKNTSPSASTPSSGGGGGLLNLGGLFGFGAASPSTNVATPPPGPTSAFNTIRPPALGPQVHPFSPFSPNQPKVASTFTPGTGATTYGTGVIASRGVTAASPSLTSSGPSPAQRSIPTLPVAFPQLR